MHLGAILTTFDERARKYALPAWPRFNERSVSLIPWFPPCENQGLMASCVALSVEKSIRAAHRMLTLQDPDLSGKYLYVAGRKRFGTFPLDSGLPINIGCDAALDGVPVEATFPYSDEPYDDIPDEAAADAPNQRGKQWLLRHEPILGDIHGSRERGIITALHQHKPVIAGMEWHTEFDMPEKGIISAAARHGHNVRGYHAVVIMKWESERKQFVARNHWGDGWSTDVQQCDPEASPGDFIIPASLIKSMVFDARAVVVAA